MARLVLVLLAVVSLGAACSDDDKGDATPRTTDTGPKTVTEQGEALETTSEGKLTVCTDIPRVPYAFEENGAVVGLDVEIVRAVAGRLGLPPEFRDTDTAALLDALAEGTCDAVASSVTITDERKKTVDFSEPYLDVVQSLLVRKADAGRFTTFAALQGRTVGAQSGTAGSDVADKEAAPQGVTVKKLKTADELFAALKAGEVDAVVHDEPVNAYNAATTGDTAVSARLATPKVQYGIAVPKGDDELRTAIDDALKRIRTDDTYNTILRTYYGDNRV